MCPAWKTQGEGFPLKTINHEPVAKEGTPVTRPQDHTHVAAVITTPCTNDQKQQLSKQVHTRYSQLLWSWGRAGEKGTGPSRRIRFAAYRGRGRGIAWACQSSHKHNQISTSSMFNFCLCTGTLKSGKYDWNKKLPSFILIFRFSFSIPHVHFSFRV